MPEKRTEPERIVSVTSSTDDSRLAETRDPTISGPSVVAGSVPGTRVGRYLIIGPLGQGGFGIVCRARDEDLGRDVAVKLPRHTAMTSPEAIEHFLHEARTVAGLKHAGVVPVYDWGRTSDGRPFVVMQLVEGRSLQERLASGPPLDHREAARLMAGVADAIAYAHKQGLVHRDLKPGNVLLDADGRPLVADFGLAVAEGELRQRAGELAGTLRYMAPEQVRGDVNQIDGRADIWAVGIMLYELLTRRLPFQARSPAELSEVIAKQEPRPPRMIDATIPPSLENIVLKCLRKPVAERYTTAHDLARDLKNWERPGNFRVWAVAAVAATLLAVCTGAVVWKLASRPASVEPTPPVVATAPVPTKGADLASLLAELRGLRRDLGGANGFPVPSPPPVNSQPSIGAASDTAPFPAQFAKLEAALASARESSDELREKRLLLEGSNQLIDAGYFAAAEQLGRRMVEMAGNDPSEVPFAYGQLGLAQARQGKSREALASYQKAKEVYQMLYDRLNARPETTQVVQFRSQLARLLGITMVRIGNVHKDASEYALAKAAYEEAQRIYETHQRNRELATLLLNYGSLESIRGNYDRALSLYERGLALARKADEPDEEAEFLVNLANTYSRKGDNAAALSRYEQAYGKLTRESSYALRAGLLGNWSTALLEEGQAEQARERLLELQTLARPDDHVAQRVLEFLPVLNQSRGTPAPRTSPAGE